jgi:hypothetical protein
MWMACWSISIVTAYPSPGQHPHLLTGALPRSNKAPQQYALLHQPPYLWLCYATCSRHRLPQLESPHWLDTKSAPAGISMFLGTFPAPPSHRLWLRSVFYWTLLWSLRGLLPGKVWVATGEEGNLHLQLCTLRLLIHLMLPSACCHSGKDPSHTPWRVRHPNARPVHLSFPFQPNVHEPHLWIKDSSH